MNLMMEDGIASYDLAICLNQLLAKANNKKVNAKHLIREENEDHDKFVLRVYNLMSNSIKSGFYPLLSVRYFAAEYSDKNKKTLWNSKGGHWIVIHKLSPISPTKTGFAIRFSDSISGIIQEGYINLELNRSAVAALKFNVNSKGKEEWIWTSNKDILQLTAPQMPLATKNARWYERTFLAINYLIYK